METFVNNNGDSFSFSREEIDRLISPYIFAKRTNRNLDVNKTLFIGYSKWFVKKWIVRWHKGGLRFRNTPDYVQKNYDGFWKDFEWKSLAPSEGQTTLMKWNGYYFWGNPMGIGRVQLQCLNRLIEFIQPRRVLEVGCGRGLKLIALSRRHRNIEFHGVDLSESGVDRARTTHTMDPLPDEFINYVPFDIAQQGVSDNLTFEQGSAAALNFSDNSFDLVFTNQSIEQMQVISDKVFQEIRRVASGKIAFIEPFYDFNIKGVCRNRVIALDYFSGKIGDLNKYGYNVLLVQHDFPSKYYMNVGLVVAE